MQRESFRRAGRQIRHRRFRAGHDADCAIRLIDNNEIEARIGGRRG